MSHIPLIVTGTPAYFDRTGSTDAASSLSSYLTNDAGIGASLNQVVMQDLSVSGVNTKRKGFNVYLESAGQISAANYDGLQVNVGATITANTSASVGQFEAAEFYMSASGTAVTLPQMNGVKIRTAVEASTAVNNVVGLLFYLPEWIGTISNYTGIGMDNPVGSGTVTNFVGVYAGTPGTGVTITNLVGLQAVGGVATNSYAITALGATAGIVNDDSTIAGSFIGHGNVSGGSFPIPLHDGWYGHSGSPEGSVSANVGSMYSRQDSTIGDAFYVKGSASGNTGWAPVNTIGPITTVTTTYSATNSDGTINCNGTFTVTLASTGVPTGKILNIKNIGTGTISVSSSVNIDFSLTQTLATQGQSLTVQWDGTQWWIY